MSLVVLRCANCGAPLEASAPPASAIRCVFCGAPNYLVEHKQSAQAQRLQLAVTEAKALAATNEQRSDALKAEFEALSVRAVQGDESAARQALLAMEGYLRLQYAPTVHIYQSQDPRDPNVVAAMKQIDDAVAQALEATRAALVFPVE